jgi:Skp family chaperone for outer membrane proteins
VRYVDLPRCMDEFVAYQSERENLSEIFSQMSQQLEQQAEFIRNKYSELELLDHSSESYNNLRLQLQNAEEDLEYDSKKAQRRASDQNNVLLERALVQINQAYAAVGERNGYSALFSKEMGLNTQFPDMATKLALLSTRPLNWSNPAYDVTDQVIEMLNASAAQPQQIEEPLQQPQPQQK